MFFGMPHSFRDWLSLAWTALTSPPFSEVDVLRLRVEHLTAERNMLRHELAMLRPSGLLYPHEKVKS